MPSITKTNNHVTRTVRKYHQSENGQQSSCMTEYSITDHVGDVALNSQSLAELLCHACFTERPQYGSKAACEGDMLWQCEIQSIK